MIRIVNNLKDQRLSPQRLTAMCEITHSQLFLEHRCRSILLSAFIAHIKKLFAESEEVFGHEIINLISSFPTNLFSKLFRNLVKKLIFRNLGIFLKILRLYLNVKHLMYPLYEYCASPYFSFIVVYIYRRRNNIFLKLIA